MKVSILNCALPLFLSALALKGDVPVRSLHERTIGVSVGNEMVYAMEQAVDWLLDRQGKDGSWGASTNAYRTTALVRTTLLMLRQPAATNAVSKAGTWLAARPVPPGEPLETYAWRLLGERDPSAIRALRERAESVIASATPGERRLWREALESAHVPPAQPETVSAPSATPPWPVAKTASCLEIWHAARTINRDFKGVIAREDGTPVNWRRDLAERLVCAQRRAATGGYWASRPPADSDLTETAFALLTFLELL